MKNKNCTEKRTTCPLDCPDSCGIIATLAAERIISLRGDDEHPYTKGVICRKMKRYHERLYSDQRILFPMKRVGKKGDGDFIRISWQQAFKEIVLRITTIHEKFGGEAILPFVYAGNMGAVNRYAGYPLFHKLGTTMLKETICSSAASAGWKSQCGDIPGCPPEVAEDAELIVIWGSNTKLTNMHFWPYVRAAQKKGGHILVIDPYRNSTAQSADSYFQVKPGGDTALALGVLKHLLEIKKIDRGFIKSSTTDFETLEKYLKETGWSKFIEQSGIKQEQMKEFASMLARNPRTFIRIGAGMTRNSRAGMGIRCITSLAAALGLFDGKKGRGVLMTTNAFKGNKDILTWPVLAKKKSREFNMVQLGNSLHASDPPIKMFIAYNSNPLSAAPDSSMVRKALESEDIFTLVHEQVMTPTARYADLLLPATTFLENSDVYNGYGHFYMSMIEPVIEPRGEAMSNFDFFQELAKHLGFTDDAFQQSIEQRIREYLDSMVGLPSDFSYQKYYSGKPIRSTLFTKGKPFYSQGGEKFHFLIKNEQNIPNHASLISAVEFDDGDMRISFPFKLITPPHMDLLNSTFGERFEGERGEVLIHPEDAKEYNIKTGDLITLYNNRGSTKRFANVSPDTQRGLLVAEGLFWQAKKHSSAINDLTSQNLTDMGGGGTFHESRVALESKN